MKIYIEIQKYRNCELYRNSEKLYEKLYEKNVHHDCLSQTDYVLDIR